MSAITRVEGRALPLPGDDVDTDRIVPARFLVTVTFEGLGTHVFEDDRAARAASASPHPFDVPAHAGASILLVNRNFGCGSSREHAPQAILRWGIRAVVGESFSEIFFGNAVAIGLPCVVAPPDGVRALQETAAREPGHVFVLDLAARTVTGPGVRVDVSMPESVRGAFLTGQWDATGLLLERFEEVEAVARKLPYVSGFLPPRVNP
jgi:3-isopropylmalate/(R)-2-methylmalate dehydratase small subunit